MDFIRFVKIFLMMVLVIILLTACTLQLDNDDNNLPTNQDPNEKDLIFNPALSRSGALVLSAADINGLYNPIFSNTKVERWVKDLVFDGLFVFNELGELESALAQTWTSSESGLTYTVKLKDNLTFHSGARVGAEDVLFTYNTIIRDEYDGEYSYVASLIESIKMIDTETIEFRFFTDKRENLNAFIVPILSESYYSFSEWDGFKSIYKAPMGTGAFKFETFSMGDQIILIKNTSYWNINAKIPGVVIRQMDETTAIQAFSEGKIDLLELPMSKSMVNNIKDLGFGNVIINKSNLTTFIGMDLKASKLSEPNIRKALLYGLDRERFINEVWHGYAEPLKFIATAVQEYNYTDSSLEPYDYNFEKAGHLLDDIGWIDSDGDGFRDKNSEILSLNWYVFVDVDWSYRLSEFAVNGWRLLGVDVRVVYVDYNDLLTRLNNEEQMDMWSLGWEMDYNINPEELFGITFGKYNFGRYNNDAANKIFEQIYITKSEREREILYASWHLIQNDALPLLPIAKLKSLWAYNVRVRNLTLTETGSWTNQVTLIELDELQ